jgi:Raf kinase inhibitor-like YbhB/YbcL family protein
VDGGADEMLEDERPEWAAGLEEFALRCPAFAAGERIPRRYTVAGEELSPPLAWGSPPEGAGSLALLMEDPDAPGGTFTHWIVVGLPPRPGDLVEGRGADPSDVAGGQALVNDAGTHGWTPPAPPHGEAHHYRFRLLALDRPLELPANARRAEVDRAISGHVIAETELTGIFQS